MFGCKIFFSSTRRAQSSRSSMLRTPFEEKPCYKMYDHRRATCKRGACSHGEPVGVLEMLQRSHLQCYTVAYGGSGLKGFRP